MAVSDCVTVTLNGRMMIDELERIWKEAVVVSYQVVHRRFPGWTKEHEHFRLRYSVFCR